jgi:hypothetical protein
MIASLDVAPVLGQVALVDATSPDFPEWGDDPWVAYRSPSAGDPEQPPFPGVAVAAGGGSGGEPRPVSVRLLKSERPTGLRMVHRTWLRVGGHGLVVGNEMSQTRRVAFARGVYPLEVWVDAARPDDVGAVAFVVWPGDTRGPAHLRG